MNRTDEPARTEAGLRRSARLTRAGLIALALVAALAACGKRGPPEAPQDKKDTLKQTYPARTTYPDAPPPPESKTPPPPPPGYQLPNIYSPPPR